MSKTVKEQCAECLLLYMAPISEVLENFVFLIVLTGLYGNKNGSNSCRAPGEASGKQKWPTQLSVQQQSQDDGVQR